MTTTGTSAEHGYFAAIDGLRAIAVLAVVLFHAGVPGIEGGYVGVDVFFVISGFLITGLLARELAVTGRIDIIEFYVRRVRRLLPALVVVLLATLAMGAVWLTAVGEQQDLAASAWATAAFASNIYFWRTQTGYFAGPSEQLPLLHMWTLAVEEQFYIVWPLVMVAVGWAARRAGLALKPTLIAVLVVGSVVSFAACVLVTPVKTTLAFFMTPFRAWEFGIGGLLSLSVAALRGGGALRHAWTIVAVAGLAAVAASIVVFDGQTLFPGYAAALPVLGSAAIIAGIVAAPAGPVVRLLSVAPMVVIGRLSYSWYLWHWPVLAIARAHDLGERSLPRDLALVGLALVLSALTYWLVEQPVRMRKPWPFAGRGSAIAAGVALLGVTAALAGGVRMAADRQLAASPLLRAAATAQSERFAYPPGCAYFQLPFAGLSPAEGCTVGGKGPPRVILWGDSFANHLLPTFDGLGRMADLSTLPRAMGACKPHVQTFESTLRRYARSVEACIAFNNEVLAALPALARDGARVVVLSARWSVTSFWQQGHGSWRASLVETIAAIRRAGFDVLIIADGPPYPTNVPNCLARRGAAACSLARAEVDRDRTATLETLRAVAGSFDRVTIWDPTDELCDTSRCTPIKDGIVTMSDSHHLSPGAAAGLAPALGRVLLPMLARASAESR